MKKTLRIVSLVLLLMLACTCCLFACEKEECKHKYNKEGVCTLCDKTKCEIVGHTWHNGVCVYDGEETTDFTDYVSQLKFDPNSGRKWANVTVRNYVDGDTTHFNISTSEIDTGILKARYLAVNTPESTGTVEPYGKVASNFTHETLQAALDNGGSVLLESDTSTWDKDSTGTRYTVWVWYKPSANAEYRNLNLELLQEGLGRASNAEGNVYGTVCANALRQAQQLKYRVHDDSVKDETFYYGDAIPLTLKELRSNVTDYIGKKVAFDGVVVLDNNNGVYVEDYDENDDISYGMYAYYGFTRNSDLKDILSVGNYVRVVGTVSEFNGTYQVSGLDHRVLYPDDPNNTVLLDNEHHDPQWKEMTIDEFYAKHTITITGDDNTADKDVTNDYAAFAQATSICMKNLIVESIYTTKTAGSDSRGAMSITCRQLGTNKKIVIRTGVLKDTDGTYGVPSQFLAGKPTNNTTDFPEFTVLQGYFVGKIFNVYGVVGYYESDSGSQYDQSPYQINVFSLANIEFVD